MPISAEEVKKLRNQTGQSMMECKKALEQSGGDTARAIEILRTKGLATAEKKSGRVAAQGRIHSYIHHNGKVGVLVEVACETDFVAKNALFQTFLNDLCLHICALSPMTVRREDIPAALIETEKRIARDQVTGKKPDNVIEKIIEGKLTKWYADHVLLEQPFVKDQERSVQAVLTELIAKTGENIVIKRFARFEVGENANAQG
jgi:elongation factor Ts